tara:strand:+ start:2214 stop:3458 length:1245 start_codon:yes stop_codon:yes gene_type:complete
MTLTQVNSAGIEDDSIVNADIKSNAAIALSKLASTPAVLTGSTDNTICTVTGANAIAGEANLHFAGTTLDFKQGNNSVNTANGNLIFSNSDTAQVAKIAGYTGSSSDDGQIRFYTKNAGTETEALRISEHSTPKLQLLGGEVEIITSASDGSLTLSADPGQNRNSTDIAFKVDASEKMSLTSTGLEIYTGNGAGASDPGYGLKVFGGTNHRDYPAIYLSGGVNNDNSGIWAKYNLTLGCDQGNAISGREIAFQNGDARIAGVTHDGITFGNDTAAANALDDYEEGTFTPTIGGWSASGTGTYNGQNGRYTKIGNLVTIWISMAWTNLTGASGVLSIESLPFAAANSGGNWGSACPIFIEHVDLESDTVGVIGHQWQTSSSSILLYGNRDNNSWYGVGIDTAGGVNLTCTYPTNA